MPETVLITGATGGIGRELALAYARPGCTLVLQGRDAARLDALARACADAGAATETRALDVRDVAALQTWLQELASRRAIDLAIINAGTINTLHGDKQAESWPDIERVLEVNVRAAFAAVSALLPHMERRGSGQIALVSSLLAYFGMPVAPAYSASKAALKVYGEALRRPMAARGVRINVALPGFVKTDMSDELRVPKPFMITARDAALRIQRGLSRNDARISFPFPLSLGCRILALLPVAVAQRVLALLDYRA